MRNNGARKLEKCGFWIWLRSKKLRYASSSSEIQFLTRRSYGSVVFMGDRVRYTVDNFPGVSNFNAYSKLLWPTVNPSSDRQTLRTCGLVLLCNYGRRDEWTVTGHVTRAPVLGCWLLHVDARSATLADLRVCSSDCSRWTCTSGTDQQPSCGSSSLSETWPPGCFRRIFALLYPSCVVAASSEFCVHR